MLTARDNRNDSILALPDFEGPAELEGLRELTRAGTIVCPGCREPLWLRAGEKRCAHFAHRVLANCPHTHVSMAILEARRLLYLFFQERIQRGKLVGPIELEPVVPALPDGVRVDLILRRGAKPSVAIVLLEAGLKPDVRWALRSSLQRHGFLLRPVFLSATLKQKKDAAEVFLLSTTQRELTHKSPFGLEEDDWGVRDSLHFVDCEHANWISLRGLHLDHPPQGFSAHTVKRSPMSELLWSEGQGEWTHPAEARAKRGSPPAPSAVELMPLRLRGKVAARAKLIAPPAVREPPSWMTDGLVCSGCEVRTNDWQTATPGADRCICKACFAKGVR